MDLYIVYLSASDHSADVFMNFQEAYECFQDLKGEESEKNYTEEDIRKSVDGGTPVVFELNNGNWLSLLKVDPRDTAKIISEVVPHKEMRYYFGVELSGTGTTMDEAWLDAIEHFTNDPGDIQGALRVEEIED